MYFREYFPEDGYSGWPKRVAVYTVYNTIKITYLHRNLMAACLINKMRVYSAPSPKSSA